MRELKFRDWSNEYEVRVCFKDCKECYNIAELCGEEEE